MISVKKCTTCGKGANELLKFCVFCGAKLSISAQGSESSGANAAHSVATAIKTSKKIERSERIDRVRALHRSIGECNHQLHEVSFTVSKEKLSTIKNNATKLLDQEFISRKDFENILARIEPIKIEVNKKAAAFKIARQDKAKSFVELIDSLKDMSSSPGAGADDFSEDVSRAIDAARQDGSINKSDAKELKDRLFRALEEERMEKNKAILESRKIKIFWSVAVLLFPVSLLWIIPRLFAAWRKRRG